MIAQGWRNACAPYAVPLANTLWLCGFDFFDRLAAGA